MHFKIYNRDILIYIHMIFHSEYISYVFKNNARRTNNTSTFFSQKTNATLAISPRRTKLHKTNTHTPKTTKRKGKRNPQSVKASSTKKRTVNTCCVGVAPCTRTQRESARIIIITVKSRFIELIHTIRPRAHTKEESARVSE